MKTILIITIFLASAVCSQAQSNTDRIIILEKWKTVATKQLKTDSINIAWLKAGKTTDSIRINNLNQAINSLLSLTASQATDITNLNTATIKQAGQIKALQDSLNLIPFMRIDTTHNTNYPSLFFRNNVLKIIQ